MDGGDQEEISPIVEEDPNPNHSRPIPNKQQITQFNPNPAQCQRGFVLSPLNSSEKKYKLSSFRRWQTLSQINHL